MTESKKKRSKKKPWFKSGDRVVWGENYHGTVRKCFKRFASKLYTLAWVDWDEDPESRDEVIKVDWLEPEPPLDTLARLVPYKTGQKVKLIDMVRVKATGTSEARIIGIGTIGVIGATNRRRSHRQAYEVHFDFLPKGRCMILFHHQLAPTE